MRTRGEETVGRDKVKVSFKHNSQSVNTNRMSLKTNLVLINILLLLDHVLTITLRVDSYDSDVML